MRALFPLAAAAILSFATLAKADTINTYTVNETFALNNGNATGTLTLDATTGAFTASNLSLTSTLGSATFTGTPVATDLGAYNRLVFTSSTPGLTLTMFLPVDSLTNYAGGNVCTFASNSSCASNYSSANFVGLGLDAVTSGTVTLNTPPPTAVTPEPSGLLLLGTGVLGIGGLLRRRMA